MRLRFTTAGLNHFTDKNSSKIHSVFPFIISTLLILLSISGLSSAQLIEKWRVDVPSPPWSVLHGPSFGFDSSGNVFIMRASDFIDGFMNFYINKVSHDGNLEWSILDRPVDPDSSINAVINFSVDKNGNCYLTGDGYQKPTGGEWPCIVKYSPNGQRLFIKLIEPINITSKDYSSGTRMQAIRADLMGRIFCTGTINYYDPGTSISHNFGDAIVVSPEGVKISESIYSNGTYYNGLPIDPLGPDMDGRYVAEYIEYLSNNQYSSHYVGYDALGGVRWSISSQPYTPTTYNVQLNPDPFWNLSSFSITPKGNLFYNDNNTLPYTLAKYSPNLVLQWAKNYTSSYGIRGENPYDESILILEPGEPYPFACYNADGTIRWRIIPHPFIYIAYGPEHNIYTLNPFMQPSIITKIDYLTGETIWSDTVDIGYITSDQKFFVDSDGDITIAGTERVIKFSQGIEITKPKENDLMIAGEVDTIKWKDGVEGLNIDLEYSTDGGITFGDINSDPIRSIDGKYAWEIPEDIIGRNSIIKVLGAVNADSLGASDIFKIKPYVITRVDENGEYVAYDINKDRWGFSNDSSEVWPRSYWSVQGSLDYHNGEDPFTHTPYSQRAGNFTFRLAKSSDYPDWPDFVRTFGVDQCYSFGIFFDSYSDKALEVWKREKGAWEGSCFGIAISNALAFQKKSDFLTKYGGFSRFTNPVQVVATQNEIPVITELYTHQFGKAHLLYKINVGLLKTPTETINDIKKMLKEDNVKIQTLSLENNSSGSTGAHAMNAYKLKQDKTLRQLYYLYVWDNNYPDVLDAQIVVDTSQFDGKGQWTPMYGTENWIAWGGGENFYLRDLAENYLALNELPKQKATNNSFTLENDLIQVYNPCKSDILISNYLQEKIGVSDSMLINNIPGAFPDIAENGSISKPLGYIVPADQYSINLSNFSDTTNIAELHIAQNNKTYVYSREDAQQTETDHIFFDDGVSISNPDSKIKTTGMWNIISDTSQERVFTIRSMDLSQGDSLKYLNPDDYKLNIISYGSPKSYEVELKDASQLGLQRFLHSNINLAANTTHKLSPNWGDFAALQLTVYVDEGNDGTIDDTLHLDNQLTGIKEEQGSLIPKQYKLEQNYPNPFNNSTVIRYSIPKDGLATLKVYNIIGEEVATLVNETKQIGSYEVTFNSDNLTSGVYLYKLTSEGFTQTKKMILLK